MNKHALYHRSDSVYAFALGADSVEIRFRAARGDVSSVTLHYGRSHGFCERRSKTDMPLKYTDGLFDYFVVRLKLADRRLAYVFELCGADGERCWYSEDGATASYDFSQAFFNFFRLGYINDNDVMACAEWMGNAVVYQIFVDRFNRGSTGGGEFINMGWGAKPSPFGFAGGDLYGIAQKLDYLTELGVNTLYLTPIFTSSSNHKYNISDYFNVDPHFGGNAAFSALMNECKKRGVRVILDAVFNHCGNDLQQFRDVVLRGRSSPYHDWFVINGDKPVEKPLNYAVFADCTVMPKWNTANPEVQDYLCGVGEHWIKNYGIDGWRLDVADEVSHGFWKRFRRTVKAYGTDKVIIGESWHDSRSFLRGDEFDSIMNYAFTKATLDFFARGFLTAERYCEQLNGIIMRNSTQVNHMMLNLLDSHDTPRFFTECGRSAEKLLGAIAVELFMPGAAMIYYGTEIPLEGGGDPDCRRCFDWGYSGEFAERLKKLLACKKLPALGIGDIAIRHGNGLLAIERTAPGQKATLFVNNTPIERALNGVAVGAFGHKILLSE